MQNHTAEEDHQFVQLYLNDPIVYACFGEEVIGVATREQVLLKALILVSKQRDQLRQEILKCLSTLDSQEIHLNESLNCPTFQRK